MAIAPSLYLFFYRGRKKYTNLVLYIFRGYCIKLSIGNTFLSVHSLALCVSPLLQNSLPCSQNSDQYLYLTAVTSCRRLSLPACRSCLSILFSCTFCTVTCSYVNILLSK
ncbi:hypothetical protein GDO78_004688 [Eleutherodactylus coqui]|uniref:Uncharacterized protein n=1 Tax=Eleutherodactylus coqui TaxID=57060 RepID=A0A8J6ESX4_ELECQ|nr:hypothetical protein GDO78_004688 [Eleutherodactylus coqui]